jgi:hypothetical protein
MITISNCSPIFHRFFYREPERRQRLHVEIPSGRQTQIGKRWGKAETDYVIEQLETFGAKKRTDAMEDINFRGLVYSVDRPLKEEEILEAASHDMQARETISAQEAVKAGVMHDATVNPRGEGRNAKETGVEILELDSINQKRGGRKGGISMNMTVAEGNAPVKMPGSK